MSETIGIVDKTSYFERAELEPILLKHGFKVGDIINEEKLYYNKTPLTYIKYEYNFLKIFYKGDLLEQSNFAFLKVFIFATYLKNNDIDFLNKHIGKDSCFLDKINSLSDLKEKLQKEVNELDKDIEICVSVNGEKAKIKKWTNTKNHYQRIIQQIEEFVL